MSPGWVFLALTIQGREGAVGSGSWLTVARGRGAAGCPDAAALSLAVARELGREPRFRAAGPGAPVHCAFGRERKAFRADVTIDDGDGGPRRARTIRSRVKACSDMTPALVLTLVLALAEAAPPRPPEPEPAPPARRTADAEAPVRLRAAHRSEARPAPGGWALSSGVVVSAGAWPGLVTGLELGVRWRRRSFGLALEGRADRAPQAVRDQVLVEGGRIAGALVPCFAPGPWAGCLVGRVGALLVRREGLPTGSAAGGALAETGVRVGWRVGKEDGLGLLAYAEMTIPLIRQRLLVAERPLWVAPAAVFSLGVAAQASR